MTSQDGGAEVREWWGQLNAKGEPIQLLEHKNEDYPWQIELVERSALAAALAELDKARKTAEEYNREFTHAYEVARKHQTANDTLRAEVERLKLAGTRATWGEVATENNELRAERDKLRAALERIALVTQPRDEIAGGKGSEHGS